MSTRSKIMAVNYEQRMFRIPLINVRFQFDENCLSINKICALLSVWCQLTLCPNQSQEPLRYSDNRHLLYSLMVHVISEQNLVSMCLDVLKPFIKLLLFLLYFDKGPECEAHDEYGTHRLSNPKWIVWFFLFSFQQLFSFISIRIIFLRVLSNVFSSV